MTHKASVGNTVEPHWTDNGDGSITVDCSSVNHTVALRSQPDHTSPIVEYTLTGVYGPFTAVANSRNYLYCAYNGGTPTILATTNVDLINESDTTPYIAFGRIDRTGNISSFSNAGSGYVQAHCSSAHGLVSGDVVTIAGSTPYDGTYTVTRVSTTDFKFLATWSVTAAGTWSSVELDILNWDEPGNGLQNKLHRRFVKTQRFAKESGVELSESAGRVVVINAGVLWYGGRAVTVSPTQSDSTTATCYLWYHSGGNWTKSPVTQYNNSQFDDGADLQTLSAGRFTVNWIYRDVSDVDRCIHIILGSSVDSSGYVELEAIGSTAPTTSQLPPEMSVTAVLVGRIIARQNAATATQIDSAFDIVSYPSENAVRNSLDTVIGYGVVSGMTLAIDADTTKFKINPGTYYAPSTGLISYAGQTAIPVTNILTHLVTYVALDVDENIVQSTTPFTESDRRQYLILGVVVHSNHTVVNAINNLPDVAVSLTAQYDDLLDALKGFNNEGNVFSYYGTGTLQIQKSIGSLFKKGVNFNNDPTTPHIITLGTLAPVSNIRFRTQTSWESADTGTIDVGYYDVGGVRTLISPTSYTVMRIAIFPSNLVRIQYGQVLYNKMSDALQDMNSENFVVEPNIAENGLFRCALVVRSSATDLSDPAQATFVALNRFGEISQAVGGFGGTTDLQQAYQNSLPPQIITNDTLGPVLLQNGSAHGTSGVIGINNIAGDKVASIDGEGLARVRSLGISTTSSTS
jgi:hypothetical protein